MRPFTTEAAPLPPSSVTTRMEVSPLNSLMQAHCVYASKVSRGKSASINTRDFLLGENEGLLRLQERL